MDLKVIAGKVTDILKKYRYALLVLVIGLVLMAIPTQSTKKSNAVTDNPNPVAAEGHTLQQQLKELLSQVDGAGKVEVVLTIGTGEETVYQCNENSSSNTNADSFQKTVVTVTDSQRNETGLIRQVNPPVYIGAVVVCEGAENPIVKLAMVDAVSKATGLGANRISVLKMK